MRIAEILAAVLAAIVLSIAVSTPAWAMCAAGDDCSYCNPCSASSWCYDPCSDPSLWCYAAAGCGGPVCSECDPSSSCYEPCTLSCYDDATCGVGPSDPSPINCGAFTDGQPGEGAQDFGFATLVEEDAPADTHTGSFTLCVDIPASGEARTLFAGDDNSAANSHGIASSVVRNFGLSSAIMSGPSLSAKDRTEITNCVQQEVQKAMSESANSITVTNSCPSAESHQPFARVIVGTPSPDLAAAMHASNEADGASAVLPDCKARKNGVALLDASRNRSNRHRCETIVHEFFHTLGLVHVEDRPPDFDQDIMQNPAVEGKRYSATDTNGRTKDDGLPRCSERQNTKKKVQQAISVLVQPVCPDGNCEGIKGENCETCNIDCGGCGGGEPFCGDHNCNGDDTCDNCAQDCGPCGGGGPGGGNPVCCEFNSGSNCLYIPCGAGWKCINNSCSPGCVSNADCAYLCSGDNGGLCICSAGQCQRTASCVCDCSGPFCCPPGDPHCSGGGGPGGGSGDPLWDWCLLEICGGDSDCADACWEFFAD
jgi:hypothetical protein